MMHELLRHVRDRGFRLSPKSLGIDGQGREVLSYIEGDTLTSQPWPMWVWSDQLLIEAAQTLTAYHAAVADFRPAAVTSRFGTLPLGADEIVCHNDFAPYNTVFVDGRIAGIIDWDLITPADPLWDLAFVAWQWVPLYPPSDALAWRTPGDCARRLRLLIDTYDRGVGDGFIDLVTARIDTSRRGVLEGAALGAKPSFAWNATARPLRWSAPSRSSSPSGPSCSPRCGLGSR